MDLNVVPDLKHARHRRTDPPFRHQEPSCRQLRQAVRRALDERCGLLPTLSHDLPPRADASLPVQLLYNPEALLRDCRRRFEAVNGLPDAPPAASV